MIITHIIRENEWLLIKDNDMYFAPSLKQDGFIHCSDLNQACKVADFIYKEESGILLLIIDTDKLDSKVIWEDLYNLEEDYPHIYGPLNLSSVVNVIELKLDINNKFYLPKIT